MLYVYEQVQIALRLFDPYLRARACDELTRIGVVTSLSLRFAVPPHIHIS